MYYKNIFSRFLFRKNFFKRVKMRLAIEKRKVSKNEYDDLVFLYNKLNRFPEVIFDCGANIGFVTYQFNKRFNKSRIYAFEPNPSVFEVLVKSIDNVSLIKAFNFGIGNINGSLQFFKNNNTGTSSFLEPNDFHKANLARHFNKVDVPVRKIDDICLDLDIDTIHILKLDIEGYELKALEGSKKLLENNKIEFIYTEVNLVPTYEGQCLIEEVIAFLRTFDFIPYNFYGSNETILKEAVITNILFMSKNVAKELSESHRNAIYAS